MPLPLDLTVSPALLLVYTLLPSFVPSKAVHAHFRHIVTITTGGRTTATTPPTTTAASITVTAANLTSAIICDTTALPFYFWYPRKH